MLDSPVVDWHDVLRSRARCDGCPIASTAPPSALLGSAGRSIVLSGSRIDFDRLDIVPARLRMLDMPILLLHSDDDGYVPPPARRGLAAARPDIVDLRGVSRAPPHQAVELRPRAGTRIGDWLAT